MMEMRTLEKLDDSHYLTDPEDVEYCPTHWLKLPCERCREDYQEWKAEMERETS